jgi:hypothetical protein
MTTGKNLYEKLYRFYQTDDRFLLIVLYGDITQDQIESAKEKLGFITDAPFMENVAIISIEKLALFLGLNNEVQEIGKINKLIELALIKDNKYDELVTLATSSKDPSTNKL